MFKSVQAVIIGFTLSLLTGCEGMVKVDQNADGSLQFSLVSSLHPCDSSTSTCTINTGTNPGTTTPDDEEPSTEVPGDSDNGEVVVQPPATDDNSSEASGYVEWTPAAYYADGADMAANEVSHYQVVYGAKADQLDKTVEIESAGLNSLQLSQLPTGTWFIAVKTVSIYGSVSDASNVLQVSI